MVARCEVKQDDGLRVVAVCQVPDQPEPDLSTYTSVRVKLACANDKVNDQYVTGRPMTEICYEQASD